MLSSLPIDDVIPELISQLTAGKRVVLEAPPGSGKTTRVPPACARADFAQGGDIVVLEPRRLAAKLAAVRVAEEMGEEPGETVGYQFRFETVMGKQTRIRFVTEGILLRRMLDDPGLRGTSTVILDEFHERSLQTDTALALLLRLQATSRGDLRLVIMSATIAGEAVAERLGATLLKAEGRRFPVDTVYHPVEGPLESQVIAGLARLRREPGLQPKAQGDTLVFLPGVGEIERTKAAVQKRFGDELATFPLYADLDRREQENAFRPSDKPKVVLATNVAETSVTIPGITAVIDTGLARIASFNAWTGIPALRLGKISQASADQRAGRAGRTAPGICLRLYSEHDYQSRLPYDLPEITRTDLSQLVLDLAAMGVEDIAALPWFEPPRQSDVAGAVELLRRLGAMGDAATATGLGREMARLPIHPRLARLVLAGRDEGVGVEAATLAACLSERFSLPADQNEVGDLLPLLQGRQRLSFPVKRLRDSLLGSGKAKKQSGEPSASGDAVTGLRRAALFAFPDRVGKLRAGVSTGEPLEAVMSQGGSARLLHPHLPTGTRYIVALDAEERSGPQGGGARIRLSAAIEEDWLLEIEPGVTESTEAVWNPQQERAEVRSRLLYNNLVLSDDRATPSAASQSRAENLLVEKAIEAGLDKFVSAETLDQFRNRLAFARRFDERLPPWDDDFVRTFLRHLAQGRRSFKEIRESKPLEQLPYALGSGVATALERLAPESLRLPGGRRLSIRYEANRDPWTESRLQDFFGLRESPKVGRGSPLVIHLLAPNKRAVQVTTDLAGFWARGYAELRKQLMRRYPKHSWPEDPLTAAPPKPGRLR